MISILFAADFSIPKTGIASTAASILAQKDFVDVVLYSDQVFVINGRGIQPVPECSRQDRIHLVFTHLEYSKLPELCRRYPDAIFHVGDWPMKYWASVRRVQALKGWLGALRCRFRLWRVGRSARVAFVTHDDFEGAVAYGFRRALYIPIGVAPPSRALSTDVNFEHLCFSGNFRYEPNRNAAFRLLALVKRYSLNHRITLLGYYADDFAEYAGENVEIMANVPSVVDFLAVHRPIYVSLIETGAGAKNKILEALVSGCPIVCTAGSLDPSIPVSSTIEIVSSDEDVLQCLDNWSSFDTRKSLTSQSSCLAGEIVSERSWSRVASQIRGLLGISSCSDA